MDAGVCGKAYHAGLLSIYLSGAPMAKIIEFPKSKQVQNVVSLETFKKNKMVFDLTDHLRRLRELQEEVQTLKKQVLLRVVKDGDDKT
jgi:hypothetical protein